MTLDDMLTGKFKGTFDDEDGLQYDDVILRCKDGVITGTSKVADGRLYLFKGLLASQDLVVLNYTSSNGNTGFCIFEHITSKEIKGIFMLSGFDSLESSCGNYTLERVEDNN